MVKNNFEVDVKVKCIEVMFYCESCPLGRQWIFTL